MIVRHAIVALLVLFIYAGIGVWNVRAGDLPDKNVIPLVLSATLLLAYGEEIAFRAYIPMNLLKSGKSRSKIIVISSAIFAIAHGINIFRTDTDIFGIVNQVLFAFFMGLLLTSLYFLTRSLVFTALYHFIINIPAAFRKAAAHNAPSGEVVVSESIAESLLGMLFFILLLIPLILVSLFYLKKIRKDEQMAKESTIDNVDHG